VLYDDENAAERFPFDISVEEKDLEDVSSHLSGQQSLRWLVLELVVYGWETDVEVLDFVQSTLFWSEQVEQVPQHVKDDFGIETGTKVINEVEKTLTWLVDHGLIKKPLGQPQTDETRYEGTELGRALVEYEHSNWFDNSVQSVLEFTEWLNDQGDELTPEKLVEQLAEEYYHCDATQPLTGDGPLSEKMELHGLSDTEGATAVLGCWFWCAGVSITGIEDALGADSLAGLSNTMSNLSSGIDSVRLLYEPFEMPTEPDWLEIFADQISEGVPGPDMYLVSNVEYLGRVLYNNLEQQLNRTGSGSDWDPGRDHFVVERLSKLLDERNDELFRDSVESTPKIGSTIGENILECVKEWNPEDVDMVEVPFAESVRDRHGSDDLTQYHSIETGSEPRNRGRFKRQ
jgi:hypothetical protein